MSEQEIKKAKDFIWDCLDEKNKNFVFKIMSTTKKDRQGLYKCRTMLVSDGTLNGSEIEENWRLSYQDI